MVASVFPAKNSSKKKFFKPSNSDCLVFINNLDKSKTMSGDYYAALLEQLNETYKADARCPYLAKKKVLFLETEVPALTLIVVVTKLH